MAETKRYRFSYPEEDDVINEFLSNQRNKSASLRILIKSYVSLYGVNDVISQYPDIDFSNDVISKNLPKKTKTKVKTKPIKSMTSKDIEDLESKGIFDSNKDKNVVSNKKEDEVLDDFNEEDLFNLKPSEDKKSDDTNSSDDILKQLRRG